MTYGCNSLIPTEVIATPGQERQTVRESSCNSLIPTEVIATLASQPVAPPAVEGAFARGALLQLHGKGLRGQALA